MRHAPSTIARLLCPLVLLVTASFFAPAPSAQPAAPRYTYRANHDPDGTGKFYMGREIAQVMGHEGAEWLDRPEREVEEQPSKLVEMLRLKPGQVVADIGAG